MGDSGDWRVDVRGGKGKGVCENQRGGGGQGGGLKYLCRRRIDQRLSEEPSPEKPIPKVT